MIEFRRIISQGEVKSKYLNLTDIQHKTYGIHFPTKGTKLIIIDNNGKRFNAHKHNNNQIWGMLVKWFEANNVTTGTNILIKYDINEKIDGKPVIRLNIEKLGEILEKKAIVEEENEVYESKKMEIPIDFEKQLESFLEKNLGKLEEGLKLYKDESGEYGRQYPTEVGTIDLLCVDKEGNFVVVELKKGKGSDATVGQIQRYMTWVKENLSKDGKQVFGVIVVHEFDTNLKYSASANDKLRIKYYKIHLEFVSEKEVKE